MVVLFYRRRKHSNVPIRADRSIVTFERPVSLQTDSRPIKHSLFHRMVNKVSTRMRKFIRRHSSIVTPAYISSFPMIDQEIPTSATQAQQEKAVDCPNVDKPCAIDPWKSFEGLVNMIGTFAIHLIPNEPKQSASFFEAFDFEGLEQLFANQATSSDSGLVSNKLEHQLSNAYNDPPDNADKAKLSPCVCGAKKERCSKTKVSKRKVFHLVRLFEEVEAVSELRKERRESAKRVPFGNLHHVQMYRQMRKH